MQNHYQSFSNLSTWVVTHNFDTVTPVLDVWVVVSGATEKILAFDYTIVDENTVNVVFTSPKSGGVRIVGAPKGEASVSYPAGYVGNGVYLPIQHYTPP